MFSTLQVFNMKSSVLYFVLFYVINCEWVEITPIMNKKPIIEVKQVSQTTTSANYEVFVKAPILKSDYLLTTPAYNWSKYHSRTTNDIVTGMPPSDPPGTTRLNMPSTTTEEFSTSSTTEYEQEEFEEVSEQKNDLAYEGFLPFLRMVQNNLLGYKNKSRRNKMSILKHLRDHLLTSIKQRIMNLWNPPKTEARGYKDEDSHMDFPSNEGALMTIGFLTFAVFLIKLVIKLVHALKYKQQYYGMTTTTTAASVVFLKRKKRDEDQQEAAKILQYIEEF